MLAGCTCTRYRPPMCGNSIRIHISSSSTVSCLVVSLANPAVAMGDHMHKWVRCTYCSRWVKSNAWNWNRKASACSWEIDSIGVLCCACYERDYPPHSEYVQTLLPVPPTTAPIIAAFAYPIYASRLAFEAYWNRDRAQGLD